MADLPKLVDDLSTLTVLEACSAHEAAGREVGRFGRGADGDGRRARCGRAPPPRRPAEEKTEFAVTLKDVGPKKIEVIKVIRQLTNLGLKEAKDLAETPNAKVLEAVGKDAPKKPEEADRSRRDGRAELSFPSGAARQRSRQAGARRALGGRANPLLAIIACRYGVTEWCMISAMTNRVLVIEDEDRIRQFLQRGLTYENYRVDVAGDGPTGLALARENPPDIVMLDWMLPGMDGLEVCRRLRAGRAGADPDADRQGHGRRPGDRAGAGADDYLVKPFASTSCWRGCGRCCGGRRPPSPRCCTSPT